MPRSLWSLPRLLSPITGRLMAATTTLGACITFVYYMIVCGRNYYARCMHHFCVLYDCVYNRQLLCVKYARCMHYFCVLYDCVYNRQLLGFFDIYIYIHIYIYIYIYITHVGVRAHLYCKQCYFLVFTACGCVHGLIYIYIYMYIYIYIYRTVY